MTQTGVNAFLFFFILAFILFVVGCIIGVVRKVRHRNEMHYQKRNCGEMLCGTCRNIPFGQNEPKRKKKGKKKK